MAFAQLIPFHVAMLCASWFYPLKSPRLVPQLDWLLMLFTPWHGAVFLISGITLAGALLLYHFAIRPFAVMRFCFGLKPKATE